MVEKQRSERSQIRKVAVGRGGEVLMSALQGMLQTGEVRRDAFRDRVLDSAFDLARVGEEGISSDEWFQRVVKAEDIADSVLVRVTSVDSWGRKVNG